ncbi:hypothetical protein BU23DRAFT_572475 [Bimuria novae-zelandiae CBS 107.79]|uniref:Uncharacterized protein n=1 Tax=Bimuria novae-zelandiae CBS 107.79 TaxID=1447943 RepID=A0A6A5UZV9_9PLEO|nr:hypothetical protein BU23DRAFT_572475 [Bimuria novae-zelandiae CBS 107.79]
MDGDCAGRRENASRRQQGRALGNIGDRLKTGFNFKPSAPDMMWLRSTKSLRVVFVTAGTVFYNFAGPPLSARSSVVYTRSRARPLAPPPPAPCVAQRLSAAAAAAAAAAAVGSALGAALDEGIKMAACCSVQHRYMCGWHKRHVHVQRRAGATGENSGSKCKKEACRANKPGCAGAFGVSAQVGPIVPSSFDPPVRFNTSRKLQPPSPVEQFHTPSSAHSLPHTRPQNPPRRHGPRARCCFVVTSATNAR